MNARAPNKFFRHFSIKGSMTISYSDSCFQLSISMTPGGSGGVSIDTDKSGSL